MKNNGTTLENEVFSEEKTFEGKTYDAERALYGITDAIVKNCSFDGPADGESALKECRNITVDGCRFNLRYPLWHTDDAVIRNIEMTEGCRAALWYCSDVSVSDSKLYGIKALRECQGVSLTDCDVVSEEFGWKTDGTVIKNCSVISQYPFFECRDMTAEGLSLRGKYSFQYVSDTVIRDSVLDTKDAFWHSKNVTVYDTVLRGEYLGWYSEGLRLVRCHIKGTQPLCYCKDLVLEDCTMEDTDLSFERSDVRATVRGGILSVKNPISGSISAECIGEIIIEPEFVNSACRISAGSPQKKG